MSITTGKVLGLIGGAVAIAGVSVGSVLLVQNLSHKNETVAQVAPEAPSVPSVPVAQVVAVAPHYVTSSKPVKNCYPTQQVVYTHPQQQPSTLPNAGAVIGGVAGGLAGSAVHGNGRDVALAAGAAIGALSGNAIQKSMNAPAQPQAQVVNSTHCSTHTVTNKVQKGYEVTYLYNGQQGMVIMDVPPTSNVLPLPITGASGS